MEFFQGGQALKLGVEQSQTVDKLLGYNQKEWCALHNELYQKQPLVKYHALNDTDKELFKPWLPLLENKVPFIEDPAKPQNLTDENLWNSFSKMNDELKSSLTKT